MALIAIVTFVVVALVGGGGYYFWNQSQNADATATAWQALDKTSAADLQAFIDDSPGEYLDEAQQALATLEETSFQEAMAASTIPALEAFVNQFPQSRRAMEAQGRIEELRLAQPAAATPETETVDPNAPSAPASEDLVPPGAATAPAPTTPGPTAITPPAQPETPAAEGEAPN